MAEKGVDIAWKDFEVVRPLSNAEKKQREKDGKPLDPIRVLDPFSGVIKKGTFTTILGSSGSGKTTFLNFLSNRLHFLDGLEYKGEVFINGMNRIELDYNSVAGYVMQEEVLLEFLKVRETLEFSASFKMSKKKAEKRATEVIGQLGLKSCEDSLVGGIFHKGISGGEKKRLAIGVELLVDPSILFLDEPTTGLDSFNAENLIELLNKLKLETGITIIATIHQPNSYMYHNFDRMLLLGGSVVVYHGEAKKALGYFYDLGFECPEYSNPAEFLLELLTNTGDKYEENIAKLKAAAQKEELVIESHPLPELFKREPIGFFKQTGILVYRSSLNITRNVKAIMYKVIANICFLLLVMAAYFQVCDEDDLTSITDRAGVIFIILVYMAFIGVNSTTSLSTDKALFIREQASHTYGPLAFYMSKLLFDIPFDEIIVAVMSVLLYLVIGLDLEAGKLFFFSLVILILDFTTRGWGNFLLISLPNLEAASAATPFIVIIQLLFAGVFINYDSIPDYLKWLEYSSMFKYSWSACMINELDDWDEDHWDGCDTGEEYEQSDMCDPLDFYSIEIDKWDNVLILLLIASITHFLSYVVLAIIAQKYRVK
jgi:ABC-type multidrug transport system ATPase subunit